MSVLMLKGVDVDEVWFGFWLSYLNVQWPTFQACAATYGYPGDGLDNDCDGVVDEEACCVNKDGIGTYTYLLVGVSPWHRATVLHDVMSAGVCCCLLEAQEQRTVSLNLQPPILLLPIDIEVWSSRRDLVLWDNDVFSCTLKCLANWQITRNLNFKFHHDGYSANILLSTTVVILKSPTCSCISNIWKNKPNSFHT